MILLAEDFSAAYGFSSMNVLLFDFPSPGWLPSRLLPATIPNLPLTHFAVEAPKDMFDLSLLGRLVCFDVCGKCYPSLLIGVLDFQRFTKTLIFIGLLKVFDLTGMHSIVSFSHAFSGFPAENACFHFSGSPSLKIFGSD